MICLRLAKAKRFTISLTALLLVTSVGTAGAYVQGPNNKPFYPDHNRVHHKHHSKYGPGIYHQASWYSDHGKACAGEGDSAFIVAHKTLPCGTKLKITYNGKTVYTHVGDRGPYIAGRDFDLNAPVARALGFNGIGTIKVQFRK